MHSLPHYVRGERQSTVVAPVVILAAGEQLFVLQIRVTV